MGNEPTKSLKTLCDMAKLRAQHHRNGDANKAVTEERAAIKFLNEDDIENALGRIAWVVKYENLNKVRDKLVIMLDTLGRKHNKVQTAKSPEDLGMAEIIYSIMYLAKELDADRKGDNKRTELQDIAVQFAKCWGKKWAESNENNESGQVSQLIIKYMQEADDPTRAATQNRLKEAADKFNVPYDAGTEAAVEDMGGINTFRNEYTVNFESKPFGMEWTGTKDGLNLWVSSIDPQGLANVKKVIPGSMIIALNGGDVQNLGAKKIHEKTLKLGLPLRVTFRKPDGLGDNNAKPQFALDEEIIKKCVTALSDPTNWDLTKNLKIAMCKKIGASEAEIACASFLAEQSIQFAKQNQQMANQMQAQMQQQHLQMMEQMQNQQQQFMASAAAMNQNQQSVSSTHPSASGSGGQSQPPMAQVPSGGGDSYNQYNNNNMGNNSVNSINSNNNGNNGNNSIDPDTMMGMGSNDIAAPAAGPGPGSVASNTSAPPQEEAGNDMDDLEARFAALRKGLQ